MKILGVIGAILLIAGIYLYIQAKTIWDKITFDFVQGFRAIDISSFKPDQLILTGQTKINPTIGITITNKNNFDIPFKDMKSTIYYGGTIIGDTSDDLYSKTLVVKRNSNLTVTDPVNIYLNQAGGKLLLEKAKGKHPDLSYTIKLKIQLFGWLWIPVTYQDTFAW